MSVQIIPITDPVYLLCILLLIISVAPIIAKQLHIPSLVVLILLGTILGTNTLGIITRDQQLILLEKFGLLYIMFIAGLQMDLRNIQRLGWRSLFFGLLTFGIPFSIGILTGKLIGFAFLSALILGIIYSPHTLISYPIMTRLGIVRQESVSVAVGGTIVTSILTLTTLSIVQAIAGGNLGIGLLIKLLILFPLLLASYFLLIPKLGKIILEKNINSLTNQLIFALCCLFIAATTTLLLGIDSIVGAFWAGLTLNRLIPLSSPLMQRIELVGNSLFIPMFLISVGVLCNPQVLFSHPENLVIASIVITGAVGSKFLAAWISGQTNNYMLDEVMIMFGLTMSRAALVLVIALFAKNTQLIDEGIFNSIVLYIIVTCLVGPLIADTFGLRFVRKNKLSIMTEQF